MIYVFLAQGFEESEALVPVDILRRGSLEVATVGIGGKTVLGSHKISVNADISEEDLCFDDMEGIVLPGGMPGTLNLEKSELVKKSINHCAQNNLPICAICAAPSILGHMGLLKDKKAVCFPGFEGELEGALLCDVSVCRDGNIITSKGAGCAIEFGLQILSQFSGRSVSDNIRKSLQCL